MIKNNLKDIAHIVLLRSDKILYELLNDTECKLNNKNNAYYYGVQDFYPNSFRNGALEYSMEYALDSKPDRFNLSYDFLFLKKLFDEYMEIDGSHIYAKKELLEKYSSLISKVHPFNLVGYKLATLYNANKISSLNITEFTKYITPLVLNTNRDFKEYADNHIHLGGSSDVSLNFFAMLSHPTPKELYTDEVFNSLPRINEFSYINNTQMNFGSLIDIAKYCSCTLNHYIVFKNLKNQNISDDIKALFRYGVNSLVNIDFCSFSQVEGFIKNGLKIEDKLLNQFFYNMKEGYSNKAWFLYNIILFSWYEKSTNKRIQKVIKIFLHITNILRSYMVMSQNLGLSQFAQFFNSKARKLETKRHQSIASNIIDNGTTKVEGKISSGAIFNNEFIKYKLAFDKEIIKKETDAIKSQHEKYFLNTNSSKRNYHFCVHFIRRDEKVSHGVYPLKGIRFSKLRKKLKKEAIKLNNYLYNSSNIVSKYDFYRQFYTDTIKVLRYNKELQNSYIDMSKLITTIDVAGDENQTPPEVFAPAIKYLRRDVKNKNVFIGRYIAYKQDGHNFVEHNKLRLSIHAGEDFNHIATGMRKVHESVKFYGMKERDRLGHALAIGLNPKEWCELNGDIFVTKLEHLDNLVWLYHQAIEVQTHVVKAFKVMKSYEKTVKELCVEIYNENYDLDDLYKAWKLREYCPIEMFDDEFISVSEYKKSVSCVSKDYDNKAKKIYKQYHTSCEVYEKGNEIIKIEYVNDNSNGFPYIISQNDLELLEAIQDRLIQKICDKEIIIETNPSSNIFIAHIHSYDKHPIFRWNPIEIEDLEKTNKFNKYGLRTSRIQVCVNTDDPAIMPTTLRNEFSLLERIAIESGHSKSKENIKIWSEKIRDLGVSIFDFDHKKCEFIKV